ncbi:protein TEX261-like isoform X2 [Tachypleus tridentatus]|uniref:protein TEX261-like isoform X2 n=1 Tax=Tachypleus tridentatus TaxID=6853 RepID=UPI003FD17E53
MLFLYFLSWISTVVHLCLIILAVAAGLYYLAELVEEFTTLTGKIIRALILMTLCIYGCLFLFEDLPLSLIICGVLSQVTHLCMLRTFPYFVLTSAPFIITYLYSSTTTLPSIISGLCTILFPRFWHISHFVCGSYLLLFSFHFLPTKTSYQQFQSQNPFYQRTVMW